MLILGTQRKWSEINVFCKREGSEMKDATEGNARSFLDDAGKIYYIITIFISLSGKKGII